MKKNRNVPSLFHYTAQAGLYGIIGKKSLWFTDIFYLNDAAEFEYTFRLVRDELEKKFNVTGLRNQIDSFIFQFMKDASDHEDFFGFAKCCVFSFSTKSDDLSQWRAYSDDGGGYCIEFDSNKIAEIADKKNLIKAECLYDEKKQREEIKNKIDETYAACKENEIIELIKTVYQAIGLTKLKKGEKAKLKEVRDSFNRELLLLAQRYKHEKFKEEAEVRLVDFSLKSEEMPFKFRPGKTMLIPYKEIEIAESSEIMPIKRIIIGPTNHPKLSKIAVEDFLMANSIDCKVTLSKIPYRAKL